MLSLLEDASEQGCDFVVFPELALTTFFPRWWMESQSEIDSFFESMSGITTTGATIISDLLGVDFGMIRPSREGTETNFASNYAGLKDKNIIIVDDVISTGSTTKEAINFVKESGGNPLLVMVLINKKADDNLAGIPLRALIRARPVRN